MKLSRLSIFLLALLIMVPVSLANAGTFRTATKDTTCLAGGTCADGYGIQIVSSNIPTSCSDSQISYIGWNLSTLSTTIQSAELTLKTYSVSGSPPDGPLTFELVTPASHSWTEDGSDPGYGTVIATTTATLTDGMSMQTVTFGGSENTVGANAIGAYFQAIRNDGAPSIATIGIRISGGCTTSTSISFNDSENTGSVASSDPDLILYTGANATAITLSTLTASAGSTPSLPLLAALIGLTAAALVWIRRR